MGPKVVSIMHFRYPFFLGWRNLEEERFCWFNFNGREEFGFRFRC